MAVESCGDIHALPEDCIAKAISLTSPEDACRLSLVDSTFRSASRSDAIWDRFLPTDYREIVPRETGGAGFRSKKDLYLHLCDHPVLIDGGLKSLSLEKGSGKKCYVLSARDLFIVWGDTPQYWRWISLPESSTPESDTCEGYQSKRFWEDDKFAFSWGASIRGWINTRMLSPGTNYAAYLLFTYKSRVYGFEQHPAEGYVGLDGGPESKKRSICLDPDGAKRELYQIVPRLMGTFSRRRRSMQVQREVVNATESSKTEYRKQRDDGWMEVELGEFFVKGGEDGKLEMSLMVVKGGNWKSGIIIQGIEIRPKEVK